MTDPRHCPQCARPLSSAAPQGLCPECLLKAALPGSAAAESTADGLRPLDASPSSTIAPEAGVRLKYFGDYELIEEIARGGMGVVWKARQTSLHRIVALKMIRAGALASPDEVKRFHREAEAAANLQHPNIVAIHEVGEHGGQHYFSMDYVAGRDLGALVQAGPLPPQRAARYVQIIAEAIHFAHQRGTLHRDLKPQNVLIDAADQPRITDFGLAKLMEHDSVLTQSGVVMGSPSYMPPEQAAGRHGEIGPPSDVYSLGAMLYELLTGRPPFRAATALATLQQVLEAEPAAPRRLKADIPPDLETICLKCLEKAPSARYPSARALAEELDRYLKGEPIQARPAGTVRKLVNWGRRHPGILAAAAALVMLGLAFGSFYLVEENAFLRAQQTDPALVRAAGQRLEGLKTWNLVNTLVMVGGIYSLLAVARRARGLSWKDLFDPAKHYRPMQPMGEGLRTFVLCVGLVCLGSAIVLLLKTIQVQVWEIAIPAGNYLGAFASAWWGLILLHAAVRDYRLTQYGVPSRQLPAEQLEPIRQAVAEFDYLQAIRLYRQTVPDAGLLEAREFVLRLADTLRAQDPVKFALPPLSLATLNWQAILICAVIEAVVFALLWVLMPSPAPLAFAYDFTTGLLFGMGMIAGLRMKGFWKRMLLLAPALAMMVSRSLFVPSVTDVFDATRGFLPGIPFGVCLMVSGFTRRRRQSVQKA
jgi:tRNA A-37 threonylcarbamoyl transferase component Bud32